MASEAKRRRLAAVAALGLLGGALAVSLHLNADRAPEPVQALALDPGAEGPVSAQASIRPPRPAQPALAVEPMGSLSGTDMDGSWSLDAQGGLQPSRALRWRFDYLLSQIGEHDAAALRRQFQAQVQQLAAAPATSAALLSLWDRYVQLQQWPWQVVVELGRPETWRASLAERQRVRNQLLGPAWALAFYAEEDRALLALIEAREAGRQPEPEAIANAPKALPNAAEREMALEAQWRAWDQRVAASRQVLAQIASAPELSPLQRQQAVQRHMASSYSASERLRAEALLGL